MNQHKWEHGSHTIDVTHMETVSDSCSPASKIFATLSAIEWMYRNFHLSYCTSILYVDRFRMNANC